MTFRASAGMIPLLLFCALAACGESEPAPPPPKTQGQLQREKVDVVTKVFTDCVLAEAGRVPLDNAVGPLVQKVVKTCPKEREALTAEVRAFYRIGNPSARPDYVNAVADASVKTLESGLREQAAMAILNRQDTAK